MVYSTTDWLSWLVVFLQRFEHILRDIRNGVTLPDRWPEDEEEETEAEPEPRSLRWWEDEGKTLADFPQIERRG